MMKVIGAVAVLARGVLVPFAAAMNALQPFLHRSQRVCIENSTVRFAGSFFVLIAAAISRSVRRNCV